MEINSIEDFISSMPENLDTNIKKARYLYLELGQRSFYDTQYKYYMNGEEKTMSIYDHKPYYNPNFIICTTLIKQYAELLTRAGIKNEIEFENGHCFIQFYDEENNCHVADITKDLKNIQFNCKTTRFGKKTISSEQLKDIDLELGYISEEKSYSDDYWYILRDAIEDSKLSQKEKLQIVMENLKRFGDILKPRRLRNIFNVS